MSFFEEFNAALEEAEPAFGEAWTLNGASWPAIEIDTVDASSRATPGGKFKDVSVSVLVAQSVVVASGVKDSDIVMVRGERVRVGHFRREGDASVWLDCGPAGVDAPR